MVTAAKAFLEGGFAEIGTGTLNEALALRRNGVSAPVHLCYQPDIQSAPAVAHAPNLQASPCLWALHSKQISETVSHLLAMHGQSQ